MKNVLKALLKENGFTEVVYDILTSTHPLFFNFNFYFFGFLMSKSQAAGELFTISVILKELIFTLHFPPEDKISLELKWTSIKIMSFQ